MSFLNSIFGGSQSAAPSEAATPAAQAPAQPNEGQQPGTVAASQGEQNPLDSFRALFNNDATQGQNTPQSMRIPQDKLAEVSSSLDFAKSVPPEALARLQSGDQTALGDILNSVARAAYMTAIDHSTGVTEHYLNTRLQSERDNLNTQARVSTVESQLNVADLNPVAQDLFRETARRVATSNPTLSASQVEEQTWSMFQAFSKEFNRDGRRTAASQPKDVDYDQFGDWS